MTDNEIIKAWERCQAPEDDCSRCPLIFEDCHQLTIDLINRQKAEIERLKEHTSASAIFELSKQQERAVEEHSKYVAKIRAEAVKELAERVKEYAFRDSDGFYTVMTNHIDNLLKEMVGDNNEN